ncbi:MAG: class I SAM-dependent methyltransferase [Candidatus Cybelea sp.]
MRLETLCDICGGKLTDAGSVPGYQEPNVYALLDCRACHTMVANPRRVDPRVYNAIYAVPGGAPGYDRYFQYARRIVRVRDPLRYLTGRVDAVWGVRQALDKYRAASVLEAGCGLGYFTYALKRAGYQVVGIDVSHEAVNQATQAYGPLYKTESIESYARTSELTFDAVVMVEVIEHLEDPITAIEDAVRLLSPGGCLVLTTPNRTYYGYDEAWSTDLPPVHLWWFSQDSIETIAARVGCIAEFVDFSEYNARFPVLHAFRSAHAAMLDATGQVLRRESLPMSLARRAGLLHEGYWLASRAAGLVTRQRSTSRPTMVAVLTKSISAGGTR